MRRAFQLLDLSQPLAYYHAYSDRYTKAYWLQLLFSFYPSSPQDNDNKKDGYRQQNVLQRQKIISIIDYDVCILEYLQPFWRYSTSKNGLTLKSVYGVLQGH